MNDVASHTANGGVGAKQQTLRAVLFALCAFGLFASHDAIIKTLGASYSPFQIVFFSVLFSFPLTTLMLMRDRTADTLRPHRPLWMAARTVAAVLTGVGAFYAFSTLPLAQVYAILFAAPLIITVLSIPILGEPVFLHRWIAIVVGLGGVLITLQPGNVELELGHAAALMAACCGAFASVVVRKIGSEERPVVMVLYPLTANFVLMGCLLPFVYKPMPIEHLGALLMAAAFAFSAMLLVISAYKVGSPSVVAPMQYSQIIWASLYGALFFDETLDRATAIGASVVIASGLYIVFREAMGGNSLLTPVLGTRPRFETGTVVASRVSQFVRAKASKLG